MKAGYKQIDFADPAALDELYAARPRRASRRKQFAVLNARFHEQEAYIVAEAGVPGAITIATNMAGRGTDIKLGGNVEMRLAAGDRQLEGAERDAKAAAIRAEVETNREIVLSSGEPADPAGGPQDRRCRAASTSSAPSGTRAAASTTSSAAAPAARAIRAARSSTCRCRTT